MGVMKFIVTIGLLTSIPAGSLGCSRKPTAGELSSLNRELYQPADHGNLSSVQRLPAGANMEPIQKQKTSRTRPLSITLAPPVITTKFVSWRSPPPVPTKPSHSFASPELPNRDTIIIRAFRLTDYAEQEDEL
jgi:hypothetical protein